MTQNLRRTNSDADEDEENYRHRSINGRPPLGQHDGDGADDSEQSNIMMMTEDSGGRLPSHAVGNEKADHSASNQEITLALEEDAAGIIIGRVMAEVVMIVVVVVAVSVPR